MAQIFHVMVFLAVVLSAGPASAGELKPLSIETADGRLLEFRVEVADTPQERARGLMFRRTLPDNQGMLFLFPDSRPRSFWMKNTYIPLDILYLDAEGRIVTLARGEPLSEEGIPSGVPVRSVIEFEEGTVAEKEISVGDQVYSPVLPSGN